MKKLLVQSTYSIQVTVDDLLKITRKDNESDSGDDQLYLLLEEISGIKSVDYDGHFGPWIWVTVDKDKDNAETWKRIEGTIKEYLK